MKIQANNGDIVNIEVWEYGKGKFRPLQTYNPIDEFPISINDEEITVYYNKSKSNIDYYYLNFEGLWHWSRDSIKKHLEYYSLNKEKSLQQTYAPAGICFGCGVANEKGLRIRSFEKDGEYVAEWKSEAHHQAFPGMLNGGIIGALLDCHSNWTAAHYLMKQNGKTTPDCTVTANYSIKLLRPTPSNATVYLKAHITESTATTATVEAELIAADKVCATCRGLFVIVKEGHPAYHRW